MLFNNFEFLASYGTFAQLPDTSFPEVVFAGRSNVGKSSLLNKIMQRKSLAHTSSTPGKTATINLYGWEKIRFVDLPGYGYAKVPKGEKRRWGELMEGYFSSGRNIRLVILLIDMRHKPTADDLNMIKFLKEGGFRYIIVLTKSDKLNKTRYNSAKEAIKQELAQFGDMTMIPFSSVSGEGTQGVKKEIENAL